MLNNSAQKPKTPSPYPRELLITDTRSYWDAFTGCPSAQTYSAYDPDTLYEHVLALNCKRWSCRHCAQKRIRQLAIRTQAAAPNAMLTLTVDPSLYQTPREAFDATRRLIPTLFAQLRSLYGDIQYLRATELTAKGWPHYHFLLRAPFLPHRVVRDTWERLTGAKIVDLRRVDRSFRAYTYLLKYLSKLHRIEWTERHLSFTRRFFPPDTQPKNPTTAWHGGRVARIAPQNYLLQSAEGHVAIQLSDSHWVLEPRDDDPKTTQPTKP